MIRLIQFLIFGHWHKWKILKEVPLVVHEFSGNDSKGTRYFCQCEKCGRVIKRDLA